MAGRPVIAFGVPMRMAQDALGVVTQASCRRPHSHSLLRFAVQTGLLLLAVVWEGLGSEALPLALEL